MKTFQQFNQYVKDHIKEYLPEEFADADVSLKEVVKSNDTVLTGLVITDPANPSITPTIYMEPFYADYREKYSMSNDQVDLQRIADAYNRGLIKPFGQDQLLQLLDDTEAVKSRISMKVLSTERNETYLSDRPHKEVIDMSAVYSIQLCEGTSVPITNALAERYGLSVDDLDALAKQNQKDDYSFISMDEIMAGIMRKQGMEDIELPPNDAMMYVLSNESRLNGAALITNQEILDDIAEQIGSNLVILPSSIHEVIVLPEAVLTNAPAFGDPLQNLKDMVHEVNGTEVRPEEVLSDNVYVYDARDHELMIADDYVKEEEYVMD